MNKITINGKTYEAEHCQNIQVKGGEVYIDGKLQHSNMVDAEEAIRILRRGGVIRCSPFKKLKDIKRNIRLNDETSKQHIADIVQDLSGEKKWEVYDYAEN